MADPDKKSAILPTDDEDARIAAIEERLERLRKLHGWSTDTVNVSAEEVQAKAADLAKRTKRAKLSLRFSYGGKPEQTVEINDEHYDIGSGEAVKLRILDSSVASKHPNSWIPVVPPTARNGLRISPFALKRFVSRIQWRMSCSRAPSAER